MNAHEQVRSQLDVAEFNRLIAHAGSTIAPHIDKLCAPEGMFAVVTMSIAAHSVATGEKDSAAYSKTIRLAAELSGVPFHALSAYGDLLLTMASNGVQCQQVSPPSDGDDDA